MKYVFLKKAIEIKYQCRQLIFVICFYVTPDLFQTLRYLDNFFREQ